MKRNAFLICLLLFFIGFVYVLPYAIPKLGATPTPVYSVALIVCLTGVAGSCIGLIRCGPALRCPNCKEAIMHQTVRTPMGGKPITGKEAVCCPHCGAIVYLRDCQVKE